MALKKESGMQDIPVLNCSGRSASGEAPIEILTPQQLAERLQVKPSWVYGWNGKNSIRNTMEQQV